MSLRRIACLALLFGSCASSLATAQAVTLDFDTLPGMPNSPGTIVPAASRLSTQYLASHGVRFSSNGGFVGVVNHAPNPTTSMPNIIGGTTTTGALSYISMVTVSFFDPDNAAVFATTDFVGVRGDKVAIPGTATMKAYSVSGQLLASQTVPDVSGGLTLSISMPGIQRVELTQTSGTIGLDDFTFDPVTPCSTVVNYCTAGTTTNGCVATLSASGAPLASSTGGFVISAHAVEGQKQGLLFYGLSGRAALPWGTGSSLLCVKSPTQRTPAQSSGGATGQCDGVLAVDWCAFVTTTPGALGAPFFGGETVDAQCWFRDPASSKTTSLSNGIEFTVCP